MTALHFASIGILTLLAIGFALRRNPVLHPPLMLAAFVADVTLVLVIEVQRHAVERVFEGPSALLAVHVGISVLVLVGYVILTALGFQLLRGRERFRVAHRRIAYVFLTLRVLNFLTSLFL